MLRRALCLLAAACAVSATSLWAAATQDPTVVVFYQDGCEDCLRMEPVLKELETQYPGVLFRYIEWGDRDASLMWKLAAAYGIVPLHFPVIFVGETAVVGASRANELLVRSSVQACASSACPSPLDSIRSPSIPWLTILLIGLAVLALGIVLLA
jgi:thiol-disulfide isomerase/thioredoxin